MKEMNKLEDIEPNFLYNDILYKNRPKSKHQKLSVEQRCAQFTPFSALTGYEEQINESARQTTPKKIITEEEQELINKKINYLKLYPKTRFKITYYVKDSKKPGGKYYIKVTNLKKIDTYHKLLILTDNLQIPFINILDIELNNNKYY